MLRLSFEQRQWLASELVCQYRTMSSFCDLHKFSTDTITKMLNGGRVLQSARSSSRPT
jgi:hypothetical protein